MTSKTKPKQIAVSPQQLEKAFTLWEREFREKPEAFASTAETLLKDTPEEVGEKAAKYFAKLLKKSRFKVGRPKKAK